MSILYKYQIGGKFKDFRSTLPDNLSKASNKEYDMKFYWKNQGKPENLSEAMDKGMFEMNEDGYLHAPSVESNTLRFLKPKDHPTVQLELDWYNSKDGEQFKENYKLKKRPLLRYYKYKER